ncbi:MAG TPA: DUF4136 domain-containing protein [Cellvibrio sp.]|nr:DUF4136 domain-containing protein [Cellvibrio sp.]
MTIKTVVSHLNRYPLVLLVLLSALIGCNSINYQEIQPVAPELKALKYYRWAAPVVTKKSGARAVEFDTTFRGLIEADMKKKGYLYDVDKAELGLDYRISVVTRPGIDMEIYAPHWTSDNRGNLVYTGWSDPQGTGDMLKHGIVTLSMRSTKTDSLLWEGAVTKLMRSSEEEIDMSGAAKIAANALIKKIPKH